MRGGCHVGGARRGRLGGPLPRPPRRSSTAMPGLPAGSHGGRAATARASIEIRTRHPTSSSGLSAAVVSAAMVDDAARATREGREEGRGAAAGGEVGRGDDAAARGDGRGDLGAVGSGGATDRSARVMKRSMVGESVRDCSAAAARRALSARTLFAAPSNAHDGFSRQQSAPRGGRGGSREAAPGRTGPPRCHDAAPSLPPPVIACAAGAGDVAAFDMPPVARGRAPRSPSSPAPPP